MEILHISAECYPAAKAGGLADVVGSLPKFLNKSGHQCPVLIPKYGNHWMESHTFEKVFEASFKMGHEEVSFTIEKLEKSTLGFDLFVANIPGRFDRPGVYIDPWSGHAYWDEFERFVSFQTAALEWVKEMEVKPGIIHCHDHHTGLIPFMMKECNRFRILGDIPSVITVHNAEYHGEQDMDRYHLLPAFSFEKIGLLDWNGSLNSLAAGLKSAWKITTVSPTYMEELAYNSNGLELLFAQEQDKSVGILNGIDTEIWDPSNDKYLDHHFSTRNRTSGKKKNKVKLCEEFDLDPELPLISFIGRLVREKGADLLPDVYKHFFNSDRPVNFLLLGTGDPQLHEIFTRMDHEHMGFFDATLEYNEKLAHEMYAGSDFLFMPSRVEPCGLNQLYSMRYGTIPIVRETGGLKDTVKDIGETEGYGITFYDFKLEEAINAINRALDLYRNQTKFLEVRSTIMKLDFSWHKSAKEYEYLYTSLKPSRKP